MRRIQLRVPAVLGKPDVMSEGSQRSIVELHTGIDAVVARSIRRQAATIVGIGLVKGNASISSLASVRSRTDEATIVKGHAHRPIGRNCQVWLELINPRGIIIDLDRSTPREALIVGG